MQAYLRLDLLCYVIQFKLGSDFINIIRERDGVCMGDSFMAEEMIFQREDLEEQLLQRFPWLKKKDSNSMVACFVGVGWFTLLSDMFLEIENHYSSLNEPLDTIDFVEIYEKFGGLQVFMFECPPGIGEIIGKYEDLSFRVCETCGDIEELRDGEWNYVVCDNCMYKHKKMQS